jgi:hypothetical protein
MIINSVFCQPRFILLLTGSRTIRKSCPLPRRCTAPRYRAPHLSVTFHSILHNQTQSQLHRHLPQRFRLSKPTTCNSQFPTTLLQPSLLATYSYPSQPRGSDKQQQPDPFDDDLDLRGKLGVFKQLDASKFLLQHFNIRQADPMLVERLKRRILSAWPLRFPFDSQHWCGMSHLARAFGSSSFQRFSPNDSIMFSGFSLLQVGRPSSSFFLFPDSD